MADIKNQLLDTLSENEQEIVKQIMSQLLKEGNSDILNKLKCADYEEIPVDIETFLHDDRYLGKGLIDETGRFTVFPYWVETLKKLFPDPLKPVMYNTLALTGAIGLGKSFMAVICLLYELYRMLCLKDPYVYYGIQPIDTITFAFMNITLDASKGVAWDKCQQLLQASPWFMSHGTVSGSVNIEWSPPKGIELIAGSLPRHIIGRALFGCFFDEVSFQPHSDVEKQKEKAKELVNAASARMKSRFMKGEFNPTLLILASSKRTEQSYMETFIQSKKHQESKTTLVVDEPQWVIRTDKDSPNKFKVAVGNKFLDSEVVPLHATEEELQIYRNRGYTLIDVPMGFYEDFIDDINIALTDIAGISTTNTNKYFSGARVAAVISSIRKNPFSKEILEVGNAPDDRTEYYDYFDLSSIDPVLKYRPLFIHMDMSISGDRTGIAGVWITGKKPSVPDKPASNDLSYKEAFVVAIKAPKGHQISFEKNRNFIYWLKEQGFNIKGISTDTFQSADTGQALTQRHFNYSIISVDRVDNDHICKPYQYLKSTVYEERIELLPHKLQQEEFIGLERNNNTGRLDHSNGGRSGSKDCLDSLCGALWNAAQHAEEYAYDYGESFELTLDANKDENDTAIKKQVIVDFQQELQNIFGTAAPKPYSENNAKNFDSYLLLNDGIIM